MAISSEPPRKLQNEVLRNILAATFFLELELLAIVNCVICAYLEWFSSHL